MSDRNSASIEEMGNSSTEKDEICRITLCSVTIGFAAMACIALTIAIPLLINFIPPGNKFLLKILTSQNHFTKVI